MSQGQGLTLHIALKSGMSQGNEEVLLVVLAGFGHPDECHAGHTHAQRCGNEELLLVLFAGFGHPDECYAGHTHAERCTGPWACLPPGQEIWQLHS